VNPEKDIIFKESAVGVYYHDTQDRAVTMVNTFKDNHEGFTDREFDRAKQARRARTLLGYTSPKDFKNMVHSNMIKNFLVSKIDIYKC
jgi:predicted Zn-dependent peptidase